MKQYIKDGKIKHRNQIIVRKNGKQIINPTEEMILEDGWVEYVLPELTDEQKLQRAINNKLHDIEWYDSSDEVNSCVISYMGQEMSYWANKTERSVLKTAIEDCLKVGRTIYRLDIRDLGISIPINCELLLTMLSQLEVYAIDCYNKTTDHIYAVKNLTTIEDIENYDYKKEYPEKLRFEL